KVASNHAEQKNHTLFVYRSVQETAEIDEIAVDVRVEPMHAAIASGSGRPGSCRVPNPRRPVRADSSKQATIRLWIKLFAGCRQCAEPTAKAVLAQPQRCPRM